MCPFEKMRLYGATLRNGKAYVFRNVEDVSWFSGIRREFVPFSFATKIYP